MKVFDFLIEAFFKVLYVIVCIVITPFAYATGYVQGLCKRFGWSEEQE